MNTIIINRNWGRIMLLSKEGALCRASCVRRVRSCRQMLSPTCTPQRRLHSNVTSGIGNQLAMQRSSGLSTERFAPRRDDSGTTIDWEQQQQHQRISTPALDALRSACRKEIAAEAERDVCDGIAAVPPATPLGWSLVHAAGTNYFILKRDSGRTDATSSSSSPTALQWSLGDDVNEDDVLHPSQRKFRSKQEAALTNMINERRIKAGRAPVQYPANRNSGGAVGPSCGRMDGASVSVFCPLRTRDPSFHDPRVDICEWTPFDVLVTKPSHRTSNAMFVSLASVNSQLRIRGVQFFPASQFTSTASHEGGDQHAFSVSSEYERTVNMYRGPLTTDLAKPLQEELLQFIQSPVHGLGITDEVREYICQMLFVVEQELYMLWLAQLSEF